MKITFLGATHEVTGSCTLIETMGRSFLIDCGMEQGADIFVNQELPVNPGDIDCVLVTHAHIDHSGNIPLLCKDGFKGKVYATEGTANLCRIMLMDSAKIQEFEAEWRNRKAKRSGQEPYKPVYTSQDAEAAISKLHPMSYGEVRPILENVQIRFNDMGHLIGSSSIEIWITEDDETRKIVFSGDVGNKNKPILKEPVKVSEADYVVVESTYGDKYHEDTPDTAPILARHIQRALDRGGNVVIPSFAVGRTQELLYQIRRIKEEGLVKGHGDFPVYMDSPLANEATAIFLQTNPDDFDGETKALFAKGINPLIFPGLKISASSEESKAINFDKTPKVIISASGMAEAGRIRHHLKHNLWRRESIILFVGYQSAGTLGRILLDGAKTVKLFGEQINVEAEISSILGMSGHADKAGLLDWLSGFSLKPKLVFVNHGEDEVCEAFAEHLRTEEKQDAIAPYSGTSFDLLTGEMVHEAQGVRIVKLPKSLHPRDARAEKIFKRLITACEKLLRIAKKSDGMANKELSKFADQVEQLTKKWE